MCCVVFFPDSVRIRVIATLSNCPIFRAIMPTQPPYPGILTETVASGASHEARLVEGEPWWWLGAKTMGGTGGPRDGSAYSWCVHRAQSAGTIAANIAKTWHCGSSPRCDAEGIQESATISTVQCNLLHRIRWSVLPSHRPRRMENT